MPKIVEIDSDLVNKCKEEGNKLFKCGQYLDAIKQYDKALEWCGDDCSDRSALYKNLSAVYLKLNDHENAIKYATKALELYGNDVKALYRRCVAYEAIANYNDAFKDALKIQHIEPNNSLIKPILRQLRVHLEEIAKQNSSTSNRLDQMLKLLSDDTLDNEKRLQSANNIIVLLREKCAIELFMQSNGVEVIKQILKTNNDTQLKLSCIRSLKELCNNNIERSLIVLNIIDLQFLIDLLAQTNDEEFNTAIQISVQTIVESLSGFNAKEDKMSSSDLLKQNQNEIDSIMTILLQNCSRRALSALARDSILELIARNIGYSALDWGTKAVDKELIENLLEVSAQLEQIHYESDMTITANTRMHVSLALDRIYQSLHNDKSRQKYNDQVMKFINSKLQGANIEDKVRATATITALLNGPIDVGNTCLGQQGVIEMMLVMAGSDDTIQQTVAVEAIIAAASKKDKCTSLANMGADILKSLFKSSNDSIKVRALVGLCKIGSVGGTDASIRPFAESSTTKLAESCINYLVSSSENNVKKWAAEGLAYLTLDADVKELLIANKSAIKSLVELSLYGDLSVLFGVITTFVNLTNSYEKQEVIPEMIELAKFAKQHVPEDHPKDAKEFVDARCKSLAQMQVISALIALSKTESKTSREMISRVFNSICEHQELRGIVVQQGAVKILMKLALENNTDKGKSFAAQALARIGITMNPEVAFPGQRCLEVVRPLVQLLHPDCTGLQNFEALMALTNMAQVSDAVRTLIFKDNGFSRIENYMFEDHEMIKRAATQCMLNLILSDKVIPLYEAENDRIKYLVILCDDEDLETAKAASGSLAMVTSVSKKCCEKVFDAKCWQECLIKLISSKDKDLQHRGVCIVYNLIDASSDTATKIVETTILEILMAICRPEVDDIDQTIKDIARSALNRAEEQKLIKPFDELNLENIEENTDE